MRCVLGSAVGLGLLCAAAVAHAGAVRVEEVYAEPDLRTEAGAVTLLLRSRLGHEATGVWVARGNLQRDGTGLAATVAVYEHGAELVGSAAARARHGEVDALAAQLATRVAALAGGFQVHEASASLGELRPFLEARDAVKRGDHATAKRALRRASYAVALRVPEARRILRAIAADDTLPFATRSAAALTAGDSATALALADARLRENPRDGAARGTRVRARLARFENDAAATELAEAGAALAVELDIARAELAARTHDSDARNRALSALLGGEGKPAALAMVAKLPPGALPPELERTALAAATRHRDDLPGLASTIGVRAAAGSVDVDGALAIVDVAELDQEEVFTLDNLLEKLDVIEGGSLHAHRVAAEVRLRNGELTQAKEVAAHALERYPDAPSMHRYLARIANEQGEHEVALREWDRVRDNSADAQRERARALVLAGKRRQAVAIRLLLDEEDSVEVQSARAAARMDVGEARAAVEILEGAVDRVPQDRALQRQLAEAYQAVGEGDRAAHALRLADQLAEAPGESPRGAPSEEISTQRVKLGPSAEHDALADALTPLLTSFTALADRRYSSVAVVRFGSSREPLYARYRTRPQQVGTALSAALRRPQFRVEPVDASGDAPIPEPLQDTDLALAASSYEADAVLAYKVRADGDRAAVTLVLYDAATGAANQLARTIEGRDTGVVEWNPWFFGLCAVAGLILLWLVVRWLGVAGGDLNVRVMFDPCADKETFAIFLRRSDRQPRLRPDFFSRMRKRGMRHRRFSSQHIGPYTRFDNLPLGVWYVHLVGRFHKGGIPTEIEPRCDKVTIQRRRVAYVYFDLVPKTTTYRVTFTNAEGPQEHVPVWLDERADQAVLTPEDGVVELEVEPGLHVLCFELDGFVHERELLVIETRLYTLTINVERERRLREAAEGIPLPNEPFPLPARDMEIERSRAKLFANPTAGAGMVAREPLSAGPPSVRMPVDADVAPASLAQGLAIAAKMADAALAAGRPASAAERARQAVSRIAHGSARIGPGPAGTTPLGEPEHDRYQKLSEIGRGSIGVVYRARDLVLERDVALKIMTDRFRAHPRARGLFLHEARSLARLGHPNIVSVYDQGELDGQPFVVMELVEGATLEEVLRTQDVSILRAVRLAGQLCAGLACAHANDIIHRDVKPANVFVTREDQVKLGDFAIARMFSELRMRQTEVRGTPPYMAPEQIAGADIDFRSDLYSVGCTLFEMVAGRPPFPGAGGQVLFHHLHTDPPRPSDFAHGVPPALDAIVASLLAKDKSLRFGSADALGNALRSVEQELG